MTLHKNSIWIILQWVAPETEMEEKELSQNELEKWYDGYSLGNIIWKQFYGLHLYIFISFVPYIGKQFVLKLHQKRHKSNFSKLFIRIFVSFISNFFFFFVIPMNSCDGIRKKTTNKVLEQSQSSRNRNLSDNQN